MNTNTKGYLFAFITVSFWSGWVVMTRLGVTTTLPPLDMIFTRFLLAGLIMLPIAIKNINLINKKNWKIITVMFLASGPFYMCFMAFGYLYAPAVHGIITPSLLPMLVAIISYIYFSETFKRANIFGYYLIVLGITFKLFISLQENHHGNLLADFLFIGGAFCFAIYSILNKKIGFDPIVTASFVSVGAMLFVSPIYAVYQFINPHEVNISGSLFQIFYQAVITGIISLITYNKAIKLVGVARASAFGALVPAMVIFLSVPVLGEIPTTEDIIFAAIMSAGVLLASGVLAFRRKIR